MILFFGFHPRTSIIEAWRRRDWSMFQHVEAWGISPNGCAFFYDPRAGRTLLHVTADPADFDERHARRLEVCHSVLRLTTTAEIRFPLHPMMNCAAMCAHLAGFRAYTPRALHRILKANGATERKTHGTEGRS